jgi:uncharacterized protein YegL
MRRLLLGLFLLVSFPSFAQQNPNKPPKKPSSTAQIKWVIPGLQPPYKNILFVVDTSGSMDGRKVEHAIRAAINISETPIDDLQIALVSFSSEVRRWEGTADIDKKSKESLSRNRWSLMPSKENLDKAYGWLQANKQSNSTHILPAVEHAFDSCIGDKNPTIMARGSSELIKKLSIIIISDGEFYGAYDALKKLIKTKQKERKKKKLLAATVGFLGVDVTDFQEKQIKILIGKKVKRNKKVTWKADLGVLGYCKIEFPIPRD